MATYKLIRSYVVRRVDEVTVEMPDDFDPEDYSFGEIDEFVSEHGSFERLDDEFVDDDDLDHKWEKVV